MKKLLIIIFFLIFWESTVWLSLSDEAGCSNGYDGFGEGGIAVMLWLVDAVILSTYLTSRYIKKYNTKGNLKIFSISIINFFPAFLTCSVLSICFSFLFKDLFKFYLCLVGPFYVGSGSCLDCFCRGCGI